jgi:hypothetical protein
MDNCMICGKGTVMEYINDYNGIPLYYNICDYCKSEYATREQVFKNKKSRIEHNHE